MLINGKKTKQKYIKNKKPPTIVTVDDKKYAFKLSTLLEKENLNIDEFYEITAKLILSDNHHKYKDLTKEEFELFKKILHELFKYGFMKVQIGYLIVNAISDSRIRKYIVEYAGSKDVAQYERLIYIDNYDNEKRDLTKSEKIKLLEERLETDMILFSYEDKKARYFTCVLYEKKSNRVLKREAKLSMKDKDMKNIENKKKSRAGWVQKITNYFLQKIWMKIYLMKNYTRPTRKSKN